ncbi:MAG: RNA polymerase sigma factor [Planctomycetota bacterium]|jgi:RNA polymerase sigma factor (sigma-70 family)
MQTTSEEVKVLEKCLKGDSQAFEAIVAEYQDLVCAITFSGVADVQQSEELAHQTFVNAWKNLSQLKDLARFRPWLYTIARNNIRNFLRKKQQHTPTKAKAMEYTNDTAADDSGPLESAIKKEYEELVSNAIKEIPEQYREPLVLYYRRQKSVRQVALSLDLSEDVVRQRLRRGRNMIKDRLSSIVEETLSSTGPNKAFTATVIASIAGLAVKGSGVAAAAGATGLMSSLTAKIVTAAAAVAIGVGAVVVYKHIANPKDEPETSQARMTAQSEQVYRNSAGQVAVQMTGSQEIASGNTLAENTSLKMQETEQTQGNEERAPAESVTANLSDSPYDYFLFTLLSRSENTRTLVLVELAEDGFQSRKIDINPYASYRWGEALSVIDGILYAIRGSSLLSINLAAGQSLAQPATPEDYACEVINFGLRPAHVYADGVLYGHVKKGENTRTCRVLDLKKKAYRDVGSFADDWDAPGYSNLPLAVSPDHKRIAFLEQDPNGLLVTVFHIDSGEIIRADRRIELVMPWIASGLARYRKSPHHSHPTR